MAAYIVGMYKATCDPFLLWSNPDISDEMCIIFSAKGVLGNMELLALVLAFV